MICSIVASGKKLSFLSCTTAYLNTLLDKAAKLDELELCLLFLRLGEIPWLTNLPVSGVSYHYRKRDQYH